MAATLTPEDRRNAIARAGAQIVAQSGSRALTHRAVDREAGIPPGSTSYYAPTRRSLINLIVEWLAARSIRNVARVADATTRSFRENPTIDGLAAALCQLISELADRHDDMRARCVLLLELDDDRLHLALGPHSTVATEALPGLVDALGQLGGKDDDAGASGTGLLELVDALVIRRAVTGATPNMHSILTSYLRGSLCT